MAYCNIEPFGPEVEDYRAGQICAAVANFAGRVLPDDRKPMTAADFISWPGKEEEEEEEQLPIVPQEGQGTGMDLEARSRLIDSVVFGKGLGDGDTR